MATFEELGSCYRVLRYCKQQDILFPRRHVNGSAHGDIRWRQPSESAIRAIITNPAYAGAFVHGRRTSDPQRQRPGRRTPAMVRRPMAEWQCIIQDAYPAYISWAQYLANQARLQRQCPALHRAKGDWGQARPAKARRFLQGLATCGLCGHRMRVAYRRTPTLRL